MRPAVTMSQQNKISKAQGDVWKNHLKFKASPMTETWVEVKREFVEDTRVDRRIHERRLFYDEYANFQEPSEWGDVTGPDGTQFALRYEYAQTDNTPRQYGSREFCEDMMQLADSGAKYRYEDIADMSNEDVKQKFEELFGDHEE